MTLQLTQGILASTRMIWAVLDTNPEGLTRANLRLSRDATSHLSEHPWLRADGAASTKFVGVTLGQNHSERLNTA